MRLRGNRIQKLRQWHRRIGIVVALELLILIFTGLILNHDLLLKLGDYRIENIWLMRWYGLKFQFPANGFFLGNNYLTWDDEKWVMDGKVIAKNLSPPVGMVELNGIRFIATAVGLYLYLPQGQPVDKIEKRDLPNIPIQKIGIGQGKLIIKTFNGTFWSLDGLNWKRTKMSGITWSELKILPSDILKEQPHLFAPNLSVERIVLDLHSGRIFGSYGPFVVDLSAAALLGLVISGLWIYRRSFLKGNKDSKV